jgi:hypothetical protein
MKYHQFLSLELTHNYYTNQKSPDFQIIPTPTTEKLLKNHRSILKTYTGGIKILLSIMDDGTLFIPLSEDLKLSFHLQLQNPDFALFTDTTEFSSVTPLLYTNDGTQAELKLFDRRETFTEELTVSQPVKPVQSHRKKDVFAEIEFNFSTPQMRALNVEKNFQIKFMAKNLRWKYYLVTDKSDLTPTIKDGEKIITFTLENPTSSDEIVTMLNEKYPGKGCYQLVSSALIPCQQSARKAIQLYLDGEKVVNALPNPPYQNFTIENRDSQEEAGLYQIVRYFAR